MAAWKPCEPQRSVESIWKRRRETSTRRRAGFSRWMVGRDPTRAALLRRLGSGARAAPVLRDSVRFGNGRARRSANAGGGGWVRVLRETARHSSWRFILVISLFKYLRLTVTITQAQLLWLNF